MVRADKMSETFVKSMRFTPFIEVVEELNDQINSLYQQVNQIEEFPADLGEPHNLTDDPPVQDSLHQDSSFQN